jgi:hypothetical protein
MISSDRMVAFWCRRLARKADSSSPSIKLCASRAASSISRRSAASRSDNSAIDGFGFSKNGPAPDEIPAPFNNLPFDKVDRAFEKFFQALLQVHERGKIIPGGRRKGDEEIRIAAIGIKPGAPSCRAEDLKPTHPIAAAERSKSVALLFNFGQHGLLPIFEQARPVPLLPLVAFLRKFICASNRLRCRRSIGMQFSMSGGKAPVARNQGGRSRRRGWRLQRHSTFTTS